MTDGIGTMRLRQHWAADTRLTREVPVVLFLEGTRRRSSQLHAARTRRRGLKSGVRLAPVIILRETITADVPDCPNATQPEPVTVSMIFIRPRMGNWQVAFGHWFDFSKFRAPRCHFCRDLKFH